MKTLQLGSIALLLLCGFISCKKGSLTNESDSSLAQSKARPDFAATTMTAAIETLTECRDCVANFNPSTSTNASYSVLTLNGNSLTPAGTTIKTIESNDESFLVGNIVKVGNKDIDKRVNVTVSHDATNVYFTFERVNSSYEFGNIEFHSPAILPVPTNNSAGNQIKYGFSGSVSKTQIVRSRSSLSACSAITFSFRVGGGGVPGGGDVETTEAISYVLRDLCPPSCSIAVGDYRTQTRGYWRNNNGQAFLTANPSVFDLAIGDGTNKKTFTTPASIKLYLEGNANGTPGVLPNGNTFGAQVLTLLINITADEKVADFSKVDSKLANLVVNIDDAEAIARPSWAALTAWNGKSVGEILSIAQKVLGGTSTEYTPSQMNEIVTAINENFDNGTVDTGLLTCGK